jgi:hypothetical protein
MVLVFRRGEAGASEKSAFFPILIRQVYLTVPLLGPRVAELAEWTLADLCERSSWRGAGRLPGASCPT